VTSDPDEISESLPGPPARASLAADVVRALTAAGETVAVAESLTGGLVIAELVGVPGASAVVRGGVVAYATPLKSSLLGVGPSLLADKGAVDPEVARQMAEGVRHATAVDGVSSTWGISTTGVAGPEPQDGQPVGTVYVGIARDSVSEAFGLRLDGDRAAIRTSVVSELLTRLRRQLADRGPAE
jgi:nicotinamide-nucleotide amidase